MQWNLVKAFEEGFKEYRLAEGDKIIMSLKYNSLQQSVRISSKGEYLSFFMERTTGFAATKVLFKNIYGVEAGKCTFNRKHDKGHIEADSKIYTYRITGSPHAKAMIYAPDQQQPLVVCDWPLHVQHYTLQLRPHWYEEYASLLLGLDCYISLFLSIPHKQPLRCY